MEGQEANNKADAAQKNNGDQKSNNVINVSVKNNPNFYVFLGKKYFETHQTIEL